MPAEFALTPRELMTLHADALFTSDARGRIIGSNEPDPERAPRLYLAVSDGISFARYRDDLPDDLVATAERLLERANRAPLLGDDALVADLNGLMAGHAPGSQVHHGLAWSFPAAIEMEDGAKAIAAHNLNVLRPHFPYAATHLAAQSPCFVIEDDGIAVSICCSSRNTPAAAEAGVFTIDAARGRGYAPRRERLGLRSARRRPHPSLQRRR